MPTQKHDRMFPYMSVFTRLAILEPTSNLEKHMVAPLIQSPLSSVSTALLFHLSHLA